ncbi:MAG: PQQ-like beta-propeller repeat protein [Acidobacteriota bacterium]|nr:PQQ-like beta-propeller repeat protein [Acidobacteriota bacterium]MDH3523153.1 PQQ-like beta-propeller repeat protein [Acidobacteriota bacterium]
MNRFAISFCSLFLALLFLAPLFLAPPSLVAAGAPAADSERFWPQWRGPLANGVAPHADPPLTWSETENVRWKVPVPGRGHGSPVVWGDRVFLLTAVASDPGDEGGVTPAGPLRFVVLAVDRRTGATLWERTAAEEVPHEGTHPDGSWASASAVTDGELVVAYFGSRGLHAYDMNGEPLWSRDFGDMATRRGFGEGSSPLLAGDLVVVNWDHEGDSFLVALDKRDGREVWRRERDEITSWATPLLVAEGGRQQVVVNATGRVRGYDLETGEPLWEAGGQTVNVVPSPVHGAGLVYATSGFRGSALKAIRVAGARGDLTGGDAVVWSHDRDTPYVPSPLLYGDRLYILKVNSGILTSLDAATGEVRFGPERLPGVEGVYASPVGAAGRVYVVGRGGDTVVLRHGDAFEVLATNHLDDTFTASPALVDGEIFLRGFEHLYCLAEDPSPAAGQPPVAD